MSPQTRSGKSVVRFVIPQVDDSQKRNFNTTYLRPRDKTRPVSPDDILFKIPQSSTSKPIGNPVPEGNKVDIKRRRLMKNSDYHVPVNDDNLSVILKPDDDVSFSRKRKLVLKNNEVRNDKAVIVDSGTFPSILTRMSPKSFIYVIQCLETFEQWKAIDDIGFSGLYWLEVHMLPLQLCRWLVENYCHCKNALILPDKKELRFEDMDVHATLGFPMGPKEVKVAPYKCSDPEYVEFYNAWRAQFDIESGCVPLHAIQKVLVNQVEGDDWFKVNFVVYVVSVLISNAQKPVANRRILMSLMNVNEISSYNWCAFVLKSLRSRKCEWLEKRNYFGGPLIFLLLVYVDRVVHGERPFPRDFYTLSGWTTPILYAREKDEMKCKQFGIGTIEDRMEEVVQCSNNEESTEPDNNMLVSSELPEVDSVQKYMLNLAKATKSTANELMNLGNMLQDGATVVQQNIVGKTLQGVAMDMVNGGEHSPEDKCAQVEGSSKGVSKHDGETERDPISLSPDEEGIYGLPIFDEAIKAAVEFCRYRKMARSVPDNHTNQKIIHAQLDGEEKGPEDKFEVGSSSSSFVIQPPNSSLSVSRKDKCEDDISLLGFDIEPPSFSLGLSQEEDVGPIEDLCLKSSTVNEVRQVQTRQVQTRRQSSRTLSIECRSPFARTDVNVDNKVSNHERMVSDYLFSDCDISLSRETVFSFKIVAYRGDFLSLKPCRHVSSSIIDCWAAFLNYREKERNISSPSRFFCSVLLWQLFMKNHGIKGDSNRCYYSFNSFLTAELKEFHWIPLRDIDLLFIPVLRKNHYYLCVFDLKGNAFYIIDNRSSRSKKIETSYGCDPSLMAGALSRYLKDIPDVAHKSKKVLETKPVVVRMHWQNVQNVTDCGVFLMRHMETFRGDIKNWDCGLRKYEFNTLQNLRAKFCCALVDFEHNASRKDVIDRAKQHKKLMACP